MNVRTKEQVRKIYDRYCDMVYRVAYLYLKNEQEALDAVQETFLRLIQRNPVFKDEEHQKAWLLRVAINYCKDVHKSFWHKKRNVYEERVFANLSTENDDDGQQQILAAVLGLPAKYKDVVYLHFYEGYSVEEIGKMLDVNTSTLRSRLSKAKELLRKELKENG